MTISSSYTPDSYAGDGVTTTFAITFQFLSVSTNVAVSVKNDTTGVITEQTAGVEYNISGSNVVFTAGNIPATGETVILSLDPDFLQTSDYAENSSFPAETLETDLDERTLESQFNKSSQDRSLKVDASVSGVNATIVASSTNANNADKYLKFNGDGDGFEIATLSASAGLGNVVEDTTPQLGGDLDLNSNDVTGTGNINITGNVSLSGTVDGRDVAADGTKLDGIEASADVTDEDNVTDALDGATLTAATVATGDKVLIQDADDSDNLKTVTAQSVADLADTDGSGDVEAVYAFRDSSAQTVSTGAATKVQLNGESYDVASSFDNSTNYRWTPTVAGKYLVIGNAYYNETTDGLLIVNYIYKNGSVVSGNRTQAGAANPVQSEVSAIVDMNGTTDYIELYTEHTKGSDASVLNGSNNTYLFGSLLS